MMNRPITHRMRKSSVWGLIIVELITISVLYVSYCVTVGRMVKPKAENLLKITEEGVEDAVPGSTLIQTTRLKECNRDKYSSLFCNAVKRWDDSLLKTVNFEPVARTKRAIFLLVRMKYLGEFIRGSRDLFKDNFYDTFYVFNDENKTGNDVVEGIPLTYIDVGHFWNEYPKNFDPVNTESTWVARGDKWGYHHMITFFWKNVHRLPEVKDVKYYMRLDGDSCIGRLMESPFNSFDKGTVYIRNNMFFDRGKVIEGLAQFTRDYIDFFNISVANPGAYHRAFPPGRVAGYYNNFEMMDIDFWLRDDVQHFVNFVDLSWGVFLHRWGDAPLRYIALALFAKPEEVKDRPASWYYKHPCRVN